MSSKHRRARASVLPLVSALVMVVGLAAAGSQQAQVPVFRSGVAVVHLDVSVLDRNRQPVRGLTRDDFTVLEDGVPRPLAGWLAFEFDAAPPPAAGWMRAVPPDVSSNATDDSRLFVLVIDDALIPNDPAAIQATRKIVGQIVEQLGDDDLTAVVFTGDNRRSQDFTRDRTRLLATLDVFSPGLATYRFGQDVLPFEPPPTGEFLDPDLWFYQSSVRVLEELSEHLSSVPNRRKALFWISPGVPMDLVGAVPRKRDGTPAPGARCHTSLCDPPDLPHMFVNPSGLPPSDMRELVARTDEVFRRAQRANVTIYPIDPTGLGGLRAYIFTQLGRLNQHMVDHKVKAQHDYLAAAAANTGGRTVMNTNDFAPGIREIFDENRAYYLIAFEPASTAADGRLRRIEVKVNRPDVEVRTRSGYYAPLPDRPDPKKAAASPEAAALGKAIGGLLPDSGLPLRASVAPFAVPLQRLAAVTIVLGVRQPIPAAAAQERVAETTELQTTAFTPEGEPRGTQRHTARVVLRPGSNGEAVYELLGRIDLPAGQYRLRMAAHNARGGLTGSVFADVTVPDYGNVPVSASPIVLGAVPGRMAAPRDLLAPLLPVVPTAERSFTKADRVTAFMRLYQSGQRPIERANVAIRLTNAADQVVVEEARDVGVDQFAIAPDPAADRIDLKPPPMRGAMLPTPAAAAASSPTDRFVNPALRTADVRYEVPVSRLPPGEYLLTIEAALGATTIRRDVRVTVK